MPPRLSRRGVLQRSLEQLRLQTSRSSSTSSRPSWRQTWFSGWRRPSPLPATCWTRLLAIGLSLALPSVLGVARRTTQLVLHVPAPTILHKILGTIPDILGTILGMTLPLLCPTVLGIIQGPTSQGMIAMILFIVGVFAMIKSMIAMVLGMILLIPGMLTMIPGMVAALLGMILFILDLLIWTRFWVLLNRMALEILLLRLGLLSVLAMAVPTLDLAGCAFVPRDSAAMLYVTRTALRVDASAS